MHELVQHWAPTKFPKQCFAISSGIFNSISVEEVDASFKDMVELGIANPPYPEFDLLFSAKDVLRYPANQEIFEKAEIIFRYHDGKFVDAIFNWNDKGQPFSLIEKSRETNNWDVFLDKIYRGSGEYYRAFLVLLATKNIIKEKTVDKLAKMGIGKNKHRHWYTTTLKIGEITENSYEGESTGRHTRPHLRRGHKRNQKWGPKLCFSKPIWIPPTFVNADEEFISTRTAYNVS